MFNFLHFYNEYIHVRNEQKCKKLNISDPLFISLQKFCYHEVNRPIKTFEDAYYTRER
jgi:hypothetical protein